MVLIMTHQHLKTATSPDIIACLFYHFFSFPFSPFLCPHCSPFLLLQFLLLLVSVSAIIIFFFFLPWLENTSCTFIFYFQISFTTLLSAPFFFLFSSLPSTLYFFSIFLGIPLLSSFPLLFHFLFSF